MKKITLFLMFLSLVVPTFGQKIKPSNATRVPYANEQISLPATPEQNLKAAGEVIFHETFDWKDPSNPSGWSLPAGWQIVDETDFGFKFIWRAGTDSIKGKYTFEPGHRYTETPEDGYLVLPMDEYNFVDGIMTENGGTAWFQLPAFDFSNRPTVVVKFRQYYRCFPSTTLRISVSSDLGVHWSNYSLAFGTPGNSYCKNPYPDVNISEVAAGMPEVWIRFVWADMERYFWCIDDLTIYEAYDYEVRLEQAWLYMTDLEADGDEGFYYMIPASQTGTDGFGGYTFKAGFLNAGRLDQESCQLNAEVFRNGVSVYNENSTKVTDIWALQRDTFAITTPMVPQGYGNYEMVLTARQSTPEDIPSNNSYRDTYYVTDSVYSISDWDFETYASTAGYLEGNNDGDYLGIIYDLKQATEANSISTLIMQRKDNPAASTKPGYGFQAWLFQYDPESKVWIEKVYSAFTDITQEMLNTWVTVPLKKTGNRNSCSRASILLPYRDSMGVGLNLIITSTGSPLVAIFLTGMPRASQFSALSPMKPGRHMTPTCR
jgi:hypothetical protein